MRIHGYELTRCGWPMRKKLKSCACGTRGAGKQAPRRREADSHPGLGEGRAVPCADRPAAAAGQRDAELALAGNQNCGKTTLFNQLTGANQHVGNFRASRSTARDGAIRGHENTLVTDLPGIYSMSPYSSEELVTRRFVLEEHPKGIINIVDATNIERNLYLTMQLMELDVPMVLALNMMDEVRENGGSVRVNEMEAMLGIPVVPISAAKNEGIAELIDHAVHVAKHQESPGRMDFCVRRRSRAARCTAACTRLWPDRGPRGGRHSSALGEQQAWRRGTALCSSASGWTRTRRRRSSTSSCQMEKERGLDRAAAIADMRFSFVRRSAPRRS